MKKLSSYIRNYWYIYIIAIISMVFSIILDMLSPFITGRIIDDVVIGGKTELLTTFLIGILLIGIGRCIFQYVKELLFDVVSSKISVEIRRNLFHHIQGLSMNFFDNTNTGELMARVKDDVDRIWNALGFVGMLIIEVIIHTSIVLFCMYRTNAKLAILPTLTMPIVACFAIIMERKLGSVYEAISEENATLNTVAEENLAGVRTVKAFARERHEIQKFLSHNKKYYDLNMKQSKIFVTYYPFFQFVTKLLPVLVILVGGRMVINQELSLGDLSAFTLYSMNIVWPMEMIGWLTNEFSAAIASNKKIKKIYEETPSITEVPNPTKLNTIRGEIDFIHVNFHKEDKHNILEDINFHIEAGKTIGIMGTTGAGKSSIIHLLQRLYDATEGSILLDGVDIRSLSLKELRSNISIVMQDVFLFSDTISENIRLGKREEVDSYTIQAAIEDAQARGFVERMDKKAETLIGERGVGLSGGQKQRISIARALAKKTPILILDDSTSALDMETEHQIQASLEKLSDTTKIIIAHRISSVKNADEIIILEEGRIVERGTHTSLLEKKGYYYQTYLAQYGTYKKEVV